MKYLVILITALAFNGCTGVVTGHVYTAEEIKQIREIAKDVYQDAKYVKEDMGK
jgi:outer membrane lipoprotein SlyB